MRIIFRGRGSIWWGWRVMLVAPRIVNDVSYVTDINHENHFSWQAQHLVTLECDACCSAHCKWGCICHGYRSWESFLVAGAVFGEMRVDSRLWSSQASCLSAKLVAVDGLARAQLWVDHAVWWYGSCSLYLRGGWIVVVACCCSVFCKWRFLVVRAVLL